MGGEKRPCVARSLPTRVHHRTLHVHAGVFPLYRASSVTLPLKYIEFQHVIYSYIYNVNRMNDPL